VVRGEHDGAIPRREKFLEPVEPADAHTMVDQKVQSEYKPSETVEHSDASSPVLFYIISAVLPVVITDPSVSAYTKTLSCGNLLLL
jgi:hypothetical protein